jgi:broad specificity phosphatase PhoE
MQVLLSLHLALYSYLCMHAAVLALLYTLIYYAVESKPRQLHFDLRCTVNALSTSSFFTGNASETRFGLRPQYTWPQVYTQLIAAESIKGQPYRLVLLGRHGEGFHNVAEAKYGTHAWDEVWSKLNGSSDGMRWGPDANLTEVGKSQATALRLRMMQEGPEIDAWYASPLSRALQTSSIVSGKQSLRVLEGLREVSGVHTCDMRSSKSRIEARFPWADAQGLSEQDEMWSPTERESDSHVQRRALTVAQVLLAATAKVISVTSHSGFIRNFLTSIDQEQVSIDTAGVIPLILTYSCV